MAQANLKAVVTAEDRASGVLGGVGSSFGKLTAAFAAGQLAANAFSKAVSLATDTVKNSVGASFQQVRQVENATFALKAYEKNGDKVNKVLKDLVAYARSDLGTLFQRQDLFDAAQTLKLYGQETDTLADKVKILSKGVSLGKTSFQELSSIVGRAAAKGRLDAVDFDMLIERGIGLDKSMRGAKVSGEELFEALDKALPAELLEGRANTIDGAFIKLQSGLRDFGATILGVDKETSQFIEGGLGDRFIKAVRKFTDFLSSPQFKAGVQAFIDKLFEFGRQAKEVGGRIAEYLQPKFEALWRTIQEDLMPILDDLWRNVIEPLIPVIGTALVGALGLAVDALNFVITAASGLWEEFKNGNPIVVGLTGFFGALAAAMAFNAVFNALTVGFQTLTLITIPNVMTSIGLLKAAIASPTVLGAIGVGAALIAIQQVIDKFIEMQNTISDTNDAIDGLEKSTDDAILKIQQAAREGQIAKDKAAEAIRSISQDANVAKRSWWQDLPGMPGRRAMGGPVSSNTPYLVGEEGPEVFVPNSSGKIIPNDKLGSRGTSQMGGTVNITVQAGAYMGNRQDARKYAQMIYDNLKDVAQSNGMTLNQMIGQ